MPNACTHIHVKQTVSNVFWFGLPSNNDKETTSALIPTMVLFSFSPRFIVAIELIVIFSALWNYKRSVLEFGH